MISVENTFTIRELYLVTIHIEYHQYRTSARSGLLFHWLPSRIRQSHWRGFDPRCLCRIFSNPFLEQPCQFLLQKNPWMVFQVWIHHPPWTQQPRPLAPPSPKGHFFEWFCGKIVSRIVSPVIRLIKPIRPSPSLGTYRIDYFDACLFIWPWIDFADFIKLHIFCALLSVTHPSWNSIALYNINCLLLRRWIVCWRGELSTNTAA